MVSSQDWSDVEEGWFYGQWETGPWWAEHNKVFHKYHKLIGSAYMTVENLKI